ncbi:MAG: hypothetical protein DRR04_06530 [Gammaproteobacteria bacterium]|nr:MAG: hypothetical protein DRQ98_03710 [Gammaproteobacteria bacterium]RLA60137.1 MAG: hypothetical protein DRR04_06530 [Gammaproteobacteria bacterium]
MSIHPASVIQRLLVSIFALVLSGCGANNSEVTHSYVDPELNKLDLEGVLVVAVTKKQSSRVNFEDAFTKAISRYGVRAQASHTLVPQQKPSSEQIIAAAEGADLDTVLVTRYIGESSEEVYHPGTVYYAVAPAFGGGRHRGFGGYYGRAYEVAYDQPVWTNNITHSLISDLYVAQSKKHLWQAVTETIQAGSNEEVRDDAIKGLIKSLKDQGLLR